ncbi:MAG: hypothetical protein ACI9GW_001651 [Halieaceae bacterium]|jgi:hypothetical protein
MNQKEWMSQDFEAQATFLKLAADDMQENTRERLHEMFSVIGRESIMEMLSLSKSAFYRLRAGAIRGEGAGLTARQLGALCIRSGYSITWIISGIGGKYLFELPLIKTTARLVRDADQALLMSEQILQNIRDIENSNAKNDLRKVRPLPVIARMLAK